MLLTAARFFMPVAAICPTMSNKNVRYTFVGNDLCVIPYPPEKDEKERHAGRFLRNIRQDTVGNAFMRSAIGGWIVSGGCGHPPLRKILLEFVGGDAYIVPCRKHFRIRRWPMRNVGSYRWTVREASPYNRVTKMHFVGTVTCLG